MDMSVCPYMEGSRAKPWCGASPARKTPGAYEMDVYCTTEEHSNCPSLLGYLLRYGREVCQARKETGV